MSMNSQDFNFFFVCLFHFVTFEAKNQMRDAFEVEAMRIKDVHSLLTVTISTKIQSIMSSLAFHIFCNFSVGMLDMLSDINFI